MTHLRQAMLEELQRRNCDSCAVFDTTTRPPGKLAIEVAQLPPVQRDVAGDRIVSEPGYGFPAARRLGVGHLGPSTETSSAGRPLSVSGIVAGPPATTGTVEVFEGSVSV